MPRPVVRVCRTKSSSVFNREGVSNSPVKGTIYSRENQNLFLNSNSFSNASWTKTRSSVTAGATGPTGLTDAWTFSEDATAGNTHVMLPFAAVVVVGRRYTISIDVKASNRSWVALQIGNGTAGTAYFNTATGLWGTISVGALTRSISLGNGWYRIFMTCPSATVNTNALIIIASADNTASFNGLNQASLLIRNAQIKEGDPDEYIATEAVAITEKY